MPIGARRMLGTERAEKSQVLLFSLERRMLENSDSMITIMQHNQVNPSVREQPPIITPLGLHANHAALGSAQEGCFEVFLKNPSPWPPALPTSCLHY